MGSIEDAREKLKKRLEDLKPKEAEETHGPNGVKRRYGLLILEDEQLNLDALVETFKRDYEVFPFTNAVTALEHVRTHKPVVDLILTDQRMPKMTGIQFLEEIRKLYPKVMKIVLTGFTETRDLMDAINKGEVHRYITKPAEPDLLKGEVKKALEKYGAEEEKSQMVLVLMDKNKTLETHETELKKSTLEILRLLGTLAELKDADAGRHALFAASAAGYLCEKLGINQDETLKIIQAAHLHDLGKMGLPDWVIKGAGSTTEAAERYYKQHPLLGEAILLVSERMSAIAQLVRHHHEWWNGKGFPDGLKEEAIPLGARIVGIAAEYDDFLVETSRSRGTTVDSVKDAGIKFIQENAGVRYDPKIVPPFIEFVKQQSAGKEKERMLNLDQLEEGMIVSQDILTERGFVLVPRGTQLKKEFLAKIKGFASYIDIRQPIAIYE